MGAFGDRWWFTGLVTWGSVLPARIIWSTRSGANAGAFCGVFEGGGPDGELWVSEVLRRLLAQPPGDFRYELRSRSFYTGVNQRLG
ncbi:MAG: hypothetical protein KatS3mg110_1574 [Pirellulaceae bacterium]|nr:MAG: hypothetical protein KatS3mg110_1574 [Pirellulaceae bacterium]